jgi:flagellar basal body-associated protein FliL
MAKKGQGFDSLGNQKKEDETKTKEKPGNETPKKKRRRVRAIWSLTIIFVIAALLAAGVWYWMITSDITIGDIYWHRPSGASKEETKKNQDKASEESGLKEYINASVQFSFRYPNTWTLVEGNNALVISSEAGYPLAYLGGQNPEFKDTDIYIQIHFSNVSTDIGRDSVGGSKGKRVRIKVDSVDTQKISYSNGEYFAEMIPNMNTVDYYFNIIVDTKAANKDKIEAYNEMLASFKFGSDAIEEAKN